MNLKLRNAKPAGFTLVELVIVMVILGIVMSIGGVILRQGFMAGFVSSELVDSTWQKRLVLQRLGQELLMLSNINNASDLKTNEITFVDINSNIIKYSLVGTNLTRNTATVATAVNSLVFNYLQANGIPATDLTNLRCIKVQADFQQPGGPATLPLQVTICPRNLP